MLRIATYLGNRSLWADEAQLAMNIVERSPRGLLDPLDHAQAAPIGFLLIEKLAVSCLGESEWTWRLLPLLAGLGSLVLMPFVARCWLSASETAVATWLVALSQPLVYYSSEVKQYSSDVLCALLVVWVSQRALQRKRAGMTCVALAGTLAMCLSHPAAFVCAGSAATLALWARNARDRSAGIRTAAVVCVWGVCFVALYAPILLRHSEGADYLRQFWGSSFPPLPPHALSDLAWPVRSFFGFFNDPAGLGASGGASVAFVLGCYAMLRAKRTALALCLFPALATLLAAALHLYPFATAVFTSSYPLQGRLLLFLVPGVCIVVAAGLGWLLRGQPEQARLGWVVAGLILASVGGEMATRPAWSVRIHEVRPLVEALAKHVRPDDVVVLNTRALSTYRYYCHRLQVSPPAVIKLGGTCLWGEYEQQLLKLPRGARVWLLYAHHPSWYSEQDEAFVLSVLDRIGQRQHEKKTAGASLYLYTIGSPSS